MVEERLYLSLSEEAGVSIDGIVGTDGTVGIDGTTGVGTDGIALGDLIPGIDGVMPGVLLIVLLLVAVGLETAGPVVAAGSETER